MTSTNMAIKEIAQRRHFRSGFVKTVIRVCAAPIPLKIAMMACGLVRTVASCVYGASACIMLWTRLLR